MWSGDVGRGGMGGGRLVITRLVVVVVGVLVVLVVLVGVVKHWYCFICNGRSKFSYFIWVGLGKARGIGPR